MSRACYEYRTRGAAAHDGASALSVASGKVAYRLYQKDPPVSEGNGRGAPLGLMIVQMLGDSRLRVEVLPGSPAADANFTGSAKIYLR